MKLRGKELAFFLFGISAIIFLYVNQMDVSPFRDVDSITHYQYSRYAFQHPYLYKDLGQGPFYTLISSVFAHFFGMNGIMLFNLVCAGAAGFLSYKVAEKLGVANAQACVIFTMFCPVFFVNIGTCHSEMLFSVVFITGIYMLLCRLPMVAAGVISLLPLIKPEGVYLLSLVLLCLVFLKQYKAIPFLAAGFIFASIAGVSFNVGSLVIVSTVLPGNINNHFNIQKLLQLMWGYPLAIAFTIGLVPAVRFISRSSSTDKEEGRYNSIVLFMTGFSVVCVFVFDCLLWPNFQFVKTIVDQRVNTQAQYMALVEVAPLLAIIALMGINWLLSFQTIAPKINRYILLFLGSQIVVIPFIVYHFPEELSNPQRLAKDAGAWAKGGGADIVYYTNPMMPYAMNIDPFDTVKVRKLQGDPEEGVPAYKSILILWDEKMGSNYDIKKLEKAKQYTQMLVSHADPIHKDEEAARTEIFVRNKK